MNRSQIVRCISVVAFGLTLLLASGASATAPMPPPQLRGNTWSAAAVGLDPVNNFPWGSRFNFGCPAPGEARQLWGTDVYNSNSSVCTAAVHAGRITLAQGGTVVIETREGLASYQGSTRNGVTSAAATVIGDGSGSTAFRVVSGATTTTTTRATTTTTRRTTTTTRPTTTTTRATGHSVTLTASATTATVGSSVKITATSDFDVGTTVYVIFMTFDGVDFARCTSGATCWLYPHYAEAGTHSFTARIARPNGTDVQARSSTVNVTWTAAGSSTTTTRPTTTTTRPRATTTTRPTTTTTRPRASTTTTRPRATTTTTRPRATTTTRPTTTTTQSVTLTASATTAPVGSTVTLTATSAIDVGPSPWYIVIFDNGVRVTSCSSGTTCVYKEKMDRAGTHSFTARIARFDGTESQAQSSTVNVTWGEANSSSPPPDDGQPPDHTPGPQAQ